MTKYTVGPSISNNDNNRPKNTRESQVEGDEYFMEVRNLQEYGFSGVEIISSVSTSSITNRH